MFWILVVLCIAELIFIALLARENHHLHGKLTQVHKIVPELIRMPATQPACQFCGNKLVKIIRSREGWFCCESCSILKLNQLPNQDRVKELLGVG